MEAGVTQTNVGEKKKEKKKIQLEREQTFFFLFLSPRAVGEDTNFASK